MKIINFVTAAALLIFTSHAFAGVPIKTLTVANASGEIAKAVIAGPAFLVGQTENNQLGSSSFNGKATSQANLILRADLRANQQGNPSLSAHPERFHMNVALRSQAKQQIATTLAFRGSHTTPVSTRVLTYETKAATSYGAGKLVAKVQQVALPSGAWRTTAALIAFTPEGAF